MSSPLAILKAAILMSALVWVPVSVLGMCCMRTWQGLLLSLASGAAGLGPILWCIGHERESPKQIAGGKCLILFGLACVPAVACLAPDGHTSAKSRIHTRYSDGLWHYDRLSIGSIIPEIDQIRAGYAVAQAFDPFFGRQQRQELSAMTDAIDAEMGQDAEFTAIGSALPAIYRELSFADFRDGHYFYYIPARLDRSRPVPALVFLHGSGGNFKSYIWLLSKIADELSITVIAPTFGMGNWEKHGAYGAITRAIADAGKHTAIDPDQIHLMGLSNGGKGVCLAESEPGPRFRSLILLSAVFHDRIKPEKLAKRLKDRPVLVISGGSDDRVPWNYVANYAARLQAGGLTVTTRQFSEDDHFLFFRKHAEVLGEIANWIRQLTPSAPSPASRD